MIDINRGTIEDLDILLNMLREQFTSHDILVEENALISAMVELLRRGDLGFFLIAREGMTAVGFAAVSFAWTLEHGGKSAWLDELYVIPERRKEGIGGELVNRVIRETHQENCRAIDLEVERSHLDAERLYDRKGFIQLQRNRWVYQVQ